LKNQNVLYTQIKTASEIWEEIRQTPYPADRWLGNCFHHNRKKFGSHDRRFISETIYSLFRHKLYLEQWVNFLKPSKSSFPVLMAAAMEGIVSDEEFQSEISFDKSLNAPASLYAELQARKLPRGSSFQTMEEELSARFSFPLWVVQRWKNNFGLEECKALLGACQMRPPLVIRANTLKISRDELLKRFQKQGFTVSETPKSPFGIIFSERTNLFESEEFREGFFEIQDEGSQIVCQKIDVRPGEVVWDVCAGGGGKSLLMAAMMQNKGRVVATDIRSKKLDDLAKRARRAGIYNIFPAELGRVGEIREVRKGIDKILVDAPCSGTGTFRRNPDAKWKLKEERFEVFHSDQVAIIENALRYLKKGGRLYYSTCSLEPAENEEVFNEVLGKHPELKLLPCGDLPDGFLRLYPHKDQTDGFFLAAAENT